MTRARRGWRAALVALALGTIVHAGEPAEPFVLGEGLTLPGNVWIGGDVTFGGEVPHHDAADVEIDDVSLLARWDPLPRLALFSEFRIEDVIDVVEHEGPTTAERREVIERLWVEYLLTPDLTLRLGKAYTPFGIWNQIHRAPFTWTTEEPAIADELFPHHATGLSLIGRATWRGWSVDGTVYGPAQDELRIDGGETEKGWLVGGRATAGRALGSTYATLGLNAAAFRRYDRRDWTTVTGLDLELSAGGHQVTGELTFRVPSGAGRTVYGFYLQDAIPLTSLVPDLYGILRVECFQPRAGAAAVGGTAGLFWRPLPFVILRADYLFANRTLERVTPGLHASIALLF